MSYKLYDPTMEDVHYLLQNVAKEMFDGPETSTVLPRRIKLSDSSMGLIVALEVTVQKLSSTALRFASSLFGVPQVLMPPTVS